VAPFYSLLDQWPNLNLDLDAISLSKKFERCLMDNRLFYLPNGRYTIITLNLAYIK
jgi:hypothetical protein